jgi:DNA excision repair protein ERCC-3
MIEISYDAAYCRIKNLPYGSEVHKRLDTALSYVDSKIDYTNKMGGYYTQYKDPTVRLLKTNRFYTGLLARVKWVIENCKEECKIIKTIPTIEPSYTVELPEWFYPHQREIIAKCLEYRRGLISAPTGAGKSLAMAWLIAHFPSENILITVPEKSLLAQMKDTLEKTLNEPIGEYSGNKKDFKRVTIGIINSLSKLAKSNDITLLENIEVLICDEAHRVGANFYIDLCEACKNTDYRLGFSATPWREAGDDKVMEGLLGPNIFEIKEQDLIDSEILARPVYVEVPYKTPQYNYSNYNSKLSTYNTKNNKPDRNEVYNKAIVFNNERNKFIINLASNYLESDSQFPCLVLIHYIEHGEILQNLFELKGYDVPLVYGKTPIRTRRSIVQDLKDNKLKIAIASSVFNEGQDIPNLGLGILCGGGGSESRIIQQLGRFIRSYPDKEKGVFIDIADTEEYYLYNNFNTRKNKVRERYPKSYTKINQDVILSQAKSGFKYL